MNARLLSRLALLSILLPFGALAASNILTWTDNSNNEERFHIERLTGNCSLATSNFREIATVGTNVITYTDSTVIVGQTYAYRVLASNSLGRSVYSNCASRTVPTVAPVAPSGLLLRGGL